MTNGSGGSEDSSSDEQQRDLLGVLLAEQELDYDEPAWGSNPVPTPLIILLTQNDHVMQRQHNRIIC